MNYLIDHILYQILYSGYYLELLTTETITLLASTKSKVTKDNVLHLEIIDVVLVYCNIIWSITRYFTKKNYIFKNI